MKLMQLINEMTTITRKGLAVGDKFKNPSYKNSVSVVVDMLEQKSLVSGEIVDYVCIAQPIDQPAKNRYDVPFSTVLRNKVQS